MEGLRRAAVAGVRLVTEVDPRFIGTNGDGIIHSGTRLRDAAVDPRPEDYRPPTNAGEPGELGNPHGPHVIALQALSSVLDPNDPLPPMPPS